MISFEPKLRNEAGKAKHGVAIKACSVKRAKFGGDKELEIAANKCAMVNSPKKIQVK